MKKVFTSLFLLMLGVMTTYATDYGLTVAGVNVTSTGNVSAGQSSGTINWDGSTLTFTNVTISSTNRIVYFTGTSSLTSLTIKFVGTNELTCTGNNFAIRSTKNLTLDGVRYTCANVLINSTYDDNGAIYVSGSSKLLIKDLFLKAVGKQYAITGTKSSTSFEIMESFLRADCGSGTYGAICDFKEAKFWQDAKLVSGTWNSTKGAVVNDSGNPMSYVTTDAPLVVGGCIVPLGWDFDLTLNPTGKTAGTITYNETTNTLTLDGVKGGLGKAWNEFNGITRFAVYNTRNVGSKNLKIVVKGTNDLSGTYRYGIHSDATFSIEGYSTTYSNNILNLTMDYSSLRCYEGAAMTIKDITLTAQCPTAGYYGIQGSTNASLVINHSKVKAVTPTANTSAIDNFSSCTLTDADVKTNYSCFHPDIKKFATGSGSLSTTVEIEVPTTKYDVWVLGHQVTNVNPTKFGIFGYTGHVEYYPSSKELKMEDCYLTAPEGNNSPGIKTYNRAVEKITLSGSNNKITTSDEALALSGDVLIEGSAPLVATSTSESGVSMFSYNNNSTLTLNTNSKLEFYGAKYGLWGNNTTSNTSKLIMKKAGSNSRYMFRGTSSGAVYSITKIEFPDGLIDYYSFTDYGTPGCYFDEENHFVAQNGGEKVLGSNIVGFGNITESQKYGITIAGTQLNQINRNGIGSQYIKAGGPTAVSYDPTNKILTLNGATIDKGSVSVYGIHNTGVDNLTIDVKGTNVINSTAGHNAIGIEKNTTIKGSGSLNLTGYYGDIHATGSPTVTLDDVDIDVEEDIYGTTDKTPTLNVKLTTAGKRIKAGNNVKLWNKISLLNGTKIIEPVGAKLSDDYTTVVTATGSTATGVVFGDASATGIEGVIMNPDAEVTGIFDAEGRQLNEMQPGVNIVRMSDGTTKKIIKK